MVYSFDELRARVAPVAKKHNLKAVYLFGSYARNEATDNSDVDILIDDDGNIHGLFALGGVYNDFCDSIEKEVDLVTLDTLEQKITKEENPWFVENLKRDMVLLYA